MSEPVAVAVRHETTFGDRLLDRSGRTLLLNARRGHDRVAEDPWARHRSRPNEVRCWSRQCIHTGQILVPKVRRNADPPGFLRSHELLHEEGDAATTGGDLANVPSHGRMIRQRTRQLFYLADGHAVESNSAGRAMTGQASERGRQRRVVGDFVAPVRADHTPCP